MQVARPATAGAYREIAGQMRFGARREGGHLFVPNVYPLDVLATAHDVGQAIEAIADDAEYALHSGRHQGIYELIRDGSSHLCCSFNLLPAIYLQVTECCPLNPARAWIYTCRLDISLQSPRCTRVKKMRVRMPFPIHLPSHLSIRDAGDFLRHNCVRVLWPDERS